MLAADDTHTNGCLPLADSEGLIALVTVLLQAVLVTVNTYSLDTQLGAWNASAHAIIQTEQAVNIQCSTHRLA
jgi:hypothetical protein